MKVRHGVSSDSNNPNLGVAKEILNYFLSNPNASDNLLGIARWRLMNESVRHNVEQTDMALKWLIAAGFIEEEQRVASGRIFHLNEAHSAAAKRFLDGQEVLPAGKKRSRREP
jgi:hypothetical protein